MIGVDRESDCGLAYHRAAREKAVLTVGTFCGGVER
jgi:hypothetical protein